MSLAACVGPRRLPTDRALIDPEPPVSTEAPREGWLATMLEAPGDPRPLEPCEERLAPGIDSALRLDLHPHEGDERVLLGWRVLVVVDAACERVLSSHPLAPFEPDGPVTEMGPTFDGVAWTRLTDEQRAQLYATDAVGGPVETRVGLLRGLGADRPTLVVYFEGSTRGARYGYHATFVRCDTAEACARLDLAHVELTAAGSAECDPYRVAVTRGGDLDSPLLWIAQPRVGVLELRQLTLDRRAGRNCTLGPIPPRRWRTVTWDGERVDVAPQGVPAGRDEM